MRLDHAGHWSERTGDSVGAGQVNGRDTQGISMNDHGTHWSPRVPREKLRRLYESEARGMIDEDLLVARTPVEKMLAIDRLIHEFHYSAKVRPDQPTRPAGVNLIEGNLASVITFLDELGGLTPELPGVASTRHQWRDTLQKFRQVDWEGIVAEERARRSSEQP
jgi:hypothetical protein